ncbi:MAG: hypothetical protein ACK5KM_06720 [Hyphomicrobiaceae bacterium]
MDIHLTDFEISLFDSIVFPPDDAGLDEAGAANNVELARILAVSLMERNAVPEHRRKFFDEPEHNMGQSQSVRAVLQESGGAGDLLYEQTEFLKYLRYFICGPELPEKVERAFRREIEERGGSGYRRLVLKIKEMTRSLNATGEQREKFYQQALEFGLDAEAAREITSAVVVAE